MANTAPIDDLQLEQYWKDGFTVVRGLLPEQDLARWARRLEDIALGRVAPAKRMLVMRDVMVAKGAVRPDHELEAIAKIQDFENDPVLDSYNQHPAVLDCVERFIGPDVQSIHCMLINKPPNVDGRHPLHQDLVYFPFRPPDRIVASWTALEPVTKENGCLVVLPGTHRGELLPHQDMDWEYVNGGYWGVAGLGADARRVHVECAPGDTIFFHPVLIHGSGRNRTQGFRRAISCHYASTTCEKIWDESEEDATRCYRPLRGKLPDYGDVPKRAPRPARPELRVLGRRSTRRA